MKKNILNLKTLAALLMAGAAFTACSNEEDIITEQPVNPAEKTYTLSIEASKGSDATTRGLSLGKEGDRNVINALWRGDEVVYVYKYNDWNSPVGMLKPTRKNSETTILRGTVTGLKKDDVIALRLNGKENGKFDYYDYSGQKGVLLSSADPIWSIEKKFDYANAGISDRITITKLEDDKLTAETSNGLPANFLNEQAIVKFTLVDKETGNPIDASRFEIKCTNHETYICETSNNTYGLTINPAQPTNELYVAIKCTADNTQTYSFTAYGDDIYTYTKEFNSSDPLFPTGKYKEITIHMTKKTWTEVDLSSVATSSETNVYNTGTDVVLTGTYSADEAHGIVIPDGATVKLQNVTIPALKSHYAGITCLGNATIILDGTNDVTGGAYTATAGNYTYAYPGIHVASGCTLTIKGTGTLNVVGGGNFAAGIGSGSDANGSGHSTAAGNIVITGGTIHATGGDGAPGIGAGSQNCGTITITGGTVEAVAGPLASGSNPAAIGTNGLSSSCGAISITGGTVEAKADRAETVIGDATSSSSSKCPSVNIGTGINQVIMYTGNTDNTPNAFYVYRYLKAATVTIGSSDITDLLNKSMVDRDDIINLIKPEFPESAMQNGSGTNDWRFGVKRIR